MKSRPGLATWYVCDCETCSFCCGSFWFLSVIIAVCWWQLVLVTGVCVCVCVCQIRVTAWMRVTSSSFPLSPWGRDGRWNATVQIAWLYKRQDRFLRYPLVPLLFDKSFSSSAFSVAASSFSADCLSFCFAAVYYIVTIQIIISAAVYFMLASIIITENDNTWQDCFPWVSHSPRNTCVIIGRSEISQAGCPSSSPINSVRVLKKKRAKNSRNENNKKLYLRTRTTCKRQRKWLFCNLSKCQNAKELTWKVLDRAESFDNGYLTMPQLLEYSVAVSSP